MALNVKEYDSITLFSNLENIPNNLLTLPKMYDKIKNYDFGKYLLGDIENCSFFEMSGTYKGTVTGRQQGMNINGCPNQDGWYDFVVDKEGMAHVGDFQSWDYTDAVFGCSVGNVVMNDGVDCNYKSKGGYTLTTVRNLTVVGQLKTGKFIKGTATGYSASSLRIALKKKWSNITVLCVNDSGGSSCQLDKNGNTILRGSDGNFRPSANTMIGLNLKGSDEVPNRTVECMKGTLNNGSEYPTRASNTSDYDTKHNLKVGDVIQFDKGWSSSNKNNDALLRISGGSRSDLIGRWFAYDHNYFK